MVDAHRVKGPFLLGTLKVDPGSLRVTWPDGHQVGLQHRIMLLLVTLAEGQGHCISREALIDRVWEGRFVDEQVLTRAISDLRKAIGDSPRSPSFVATVPKRGYRVLVAVTDLETEGAVTAASQPPEEKVQALPGTWWMVLVAAMFTMLWFFFQSNPGKAPRPEVNAAFLKGRYFLGKGSVDDLLRAQAYFENALMLDSRHLGARKGLAESWLRSAMPGHQKAGMIQDLLEPARAWAAEDAEWNYLLGDVALYYERDAARAGPFLEAAVRHGPGNAAFLHGLGSYHLALGDGALARRYLDEARLANPVSTLIRCDLSWTLLMTGDLEAAGELSLETLNLEPSNPHAHACLLQVYRLQERLVSAKTEALWLMNYAEAPYSELAQVESAQPDLALDLYGQWRIETLRDYQNSQYLDPFLLAAAYAQAGQTENAVLALEAAEGVQSPHLIYLGMDPRFHALCRSDRFQTIVDRTRLKHEDAR